MKKIYLIIISILIIFFLGQNLNPFSYSFFTFHDETQPARIQQFVKELKSFHLPPRVAPDMNFDVGYPLFNFYAPFPYFLTSIINLLGINIINSLKLSFLIALIVGFFSTYKFLNLFFNFYPSIIGAILYITSLYLPLNIFVRGNLGEIWFLSLFPLGMYFFTKTARNKKFNKKFFLIKIAVLSFILTSHNIYSLIFIFLSLAYIIFIKKNWRINFLALLFAFLLSAYFYLPLFSEMKYTWAKEVAVSTSYKEHFLCWWQLWQSSWGFGGSVSGCLNDGLSFKIGKIQIALYVLSILYIIFYFIKKRKINIELNYSLFFVIYSLFFLFLTTYQSVFIWTIFEPFLKVVQFPWRFIGLSLIGVIFLNTYILNQTEIFKKLTFSFLLIFIVLIISSKYFVGQKISNYLFNKKYLSEKYIQTKVAYKVAEYLPKKNNYLFWRSLENKKVAIKDSKKLTLKPFSKTDQTLIEKIANTVTLVTLLFLIVLPKNFYNFKKYGKRI